MTRRLPPLAIPLGLGGLIPMVACGYASVASHAPRAIASVLPPDRAFFALIAYASCILSFLGAVHWGLALAARSSAVLPVARRHEAFQLAGGVLPALVGWAALLLAAPAGAPLAATIVLAIGFAAVLAAEHRGSRLVPGFPAAYLALRWVLSIVVFVVLLGVLVMREAHLRFG